MRSYVCIYIYGLLPEFIVLFRNILLNIYYFLNNTKLNKFRNNRKIKNPLFRRYNVKYSVNRKYNCE